MPLAQSFVTKGYGLIGDRYAEGRGAYSRSKVPKIRHVSLIAAEAIAAANEGLEQPFEEAETRRNLVTIGLELNDLVGAEFSIGGILMRGVELCDPCRRPEKLAGKPGFEEAFQGRGGLRAEALASGIIVVGNIIEL